MLSIWKLHFLIPQNNSFISLKNRWKVVLPNQPWIQRTFPLYIHEKTGEKAQTTGEWSTSATGANHHSELNGLYWFAKKEISYIIKGTCCWFDDIILQEPVAEHHEHYAQMLSISVNLTFSLIKLVH